MKRAATILVILALLATPAMIGAEGVEGTLRVFLLLTQRAGPEMLNKVLGDIGASSPNNVDWGRKMTLIKKVAPDTYMVDIKNVEACHFKDCVPCPPQSREVVVFANQTTDAIFRWKAKYDRATKKWVCN